MAFVTADRVKDTSTTTGTGNISVSGSAPFGYRTFSTVLSVADTFYYAIQGQSTAEWEIGVGTYASTNQFARTTVLASSAGGSAVSFSSGTKNVFITLAATRTLQLKSSDTPTAGSIPYGDGSTLSYSSVGTSGQVLTSGGAGAPTWASASTGSVTSVNVSGGTTGLTASGGPVTSSGTITLAGTLAIANGGTNGTATATAGGISYGTGTAYAFSPAGTSGQVLTSGGAGAPTWATVTGTGTVTSVNVSGGTTGLTASGGPITSSGTITLAGTLAIANGGTGLFSTPANGALDIGNGTGFTRTTLTAGSNITITNGAGSISIAAAGGAPGGSTTQIQYNNAGAFAGSANMTFDGTNLTSGGTVVMASSFKRNRIINGNMYVAQRATSATVTAGTGVPTASTGYPCVDRFFVYSTGANVTAAQVAGSGANKNLLQITGAASVTAVGIGQRIEQLNSYDLAGQTCTLSVNIANSLLTTVTWTASYATTADTFGTIGTPTKTQISTGTFTVTSTLTQYTVNIAVPAAATTGVEILFTVGAQTSGTWTVGNVQLEPGSVVTPYERQIYSDQFAQCQRYFTKLGGDVANDVLFGGYGTGGGGSYVSMAFPVKMRGSPSGAIVGTWTVSNCGQPTVFATGTSTISFSSVVTVTGAFNWQTSGTSTYITASAEL